MYHNVLQLRTVQSFRCGVFSAVYHSTRIAGRRGPMRSFAMNIYSGDVLSKDVLKSFHNWLQGGHRTSARKLDKDLDFLWASKGGNVDLSVVKRWFQHWFDSWLHVHRLQIFCHNPVATNNFGLCFAKFYRHFLAATFFHLATEKKIWLPVGACRKKVNFGPWLCFVFSTLNSLWYLTGHWLIYLLINSSSSREHAWTCSGGIQSHEEGRLETMQVLHISC